MFSKSERVKPIHHRENKMITEFCKKFNVKIELFLQTVVLDGELKNIFFIIVCHVNCTTRRD